MAREQAERIVDQIFEDLRDRKFLKWLFAEEPEAMGPILHERNGAPLMALSSRVQDEIREAWIEIVINQR